MSAFDDDDGFPPEATKERPQPAQVNPLDWPDLAGKTPPERRWAIKGWLGYGHTTLLVGSGGIGKTLLAQQMGSALALGCPFIEEIPEPCRVLMWACEDDHDELWRRQVAIARHMRKGIEEFGNFTLVPRHGQDNALCGLEMGRMYLTPLINTLTEQANDLNADVVILDNVAQLYGANENDRHSVTKFLNHLSGALQHRAIFLLSHPSRAQGSEYSGSGAWENVARTRLYLGAKLPGEKTDETAEANEDDRYLARRKSNYSNKDWRKLTYAEGVLVPEVPQEASGLIGHLRVQAAEKIVLEAIHKFQGMGLVVKEGQKSPQYLPKLILEYKLGNGQSKPEIAQALRNLMMDGKVIKATIGKNENRTPKESLVVAQ